MADAEHRVDEYKPSSDSLLLRATAWGIGAALALGVFAFSAQSETGNERLQLALNGMEMAPAKTAVAAVSPEPSAKAIETKLDRLLAEREQLTARLSAVEQGLQDVTGSVRAVEKREPPPAPRPLLEMPIIPSLATLPPSSVPSSELAKVPEVTAAAEPASTAEPEKEAAAPPSPDTALPRPRVAARVPAALGEFGIELGIAPNMAALQTRWIGVKANFGPLLVGLSPIGVKDKRPGNTNLHLVAGPLPSLAAARELCAKFAAQNGYCWPSRVDAAEVVQR